MSDHRLQLQFQTWRAKLWARLMWIVSPIVGRERAERWAMAGAVRLLRYRIAGERAWRRMCNG